MPYIGHIADQETARKSAGSALSGQNILGVLAASLSSVAVAQGAAVTAQAGNTVNIADKIWATPCSRGYQIASNLGGTFASSYTTLYASLPDSAGHQRQMIQS